MELWAYTTTGTLGLGLESLPAAAAPETGCPCLDFTYSEKLETSDVWKNEMRDSKLAKRQDTEEFKAESIRLAKSIGGHEAARRLGVPVSSLGNWSRQRRAAGALTSECAEVSTAMPARRPVSELEAENIRLRCAEISPMRSWMWKYFEK
jgi:transposase